MSRLPLLYIGVAASLVECAHIWVAEIPAYKTREEYHSRLRAFPYKEIGAYALSFSDPAAFTFRTGI